MKSIIPPMRNGFSRMILDAQIAEARSIHAERKKRFALVKTRKQAEAWREEALKKIKSCFGPFPKKTALHARVTGVIEEKDFRIEKVVFESRPQMLVTANLYIPARLRGPAPAVLYNCGHTNDGKAGEKTQKCAQELVHDGYVVCVFDPLSQGERGQHVALPPDHVYRKECATAHTILGQQLQLSGEFFGTWMVWDGMRALDYLLTRPEVDPTRVGVTGNSGGGCLTTYLWALDTRFAIGAPSCWVNSFTAVIENEVGGDAEQVPPGALAKGIEHTDFFLARAPKPILLIGQKDDFFDRRALRETADEVAQIYRLFNAKDRSDCFIGSHTHGYFSDGRDVMRKFFNRYFKVRSKGKPKIKLYKPEELFVFPKGEVCLSGSRSVHDLHGEIVKSLEKKRRVPATRATFQKAIIDVLRLRDYKTGRAGNYRNLRSDWLPGQRLFGRYAVETELGVETVLRKAMAPAPGLVQALNVEKKVLLYVPDQSSEMDFYESSIAKRLLKSLPVFSVDVRGVGESACRDKPDEGVHYWMDYLAQSFDENLGRSHLGRKVFDLLKTCDLLVKEGAQKIRLVARGRGALIAAFAAALHPHVPSAELHEAPTSFSDATKIDEVTWWASMYPRGILQKFDLPDLYKMFQGKLRVVSYRKKI